MRVVLCLLLVAALGGCAGTDSNPGERASDRPVALDREAVRDDLAGLYAGDAPKPADVEAGRCFADEVLDTTTPEELHQGGLVDDSGRLVDQLPTLPEDLAGKVADAQLACTDVVDASTRALTSARRGDLDAAAYADCLRAEVPEAAQRDALVATLTGEWDDPALTRLSEAQVSCATEQD